MIARVVGFALLAGCGSVEQTSACARYVACVDARDAALGIETDVARFEASGDCWGSSEGAALCDQACARGAEWLRDTDPTLVDACSP